MERAEQNIYLDCYTGFSSAKIREHDKENDYSFEKIEQIYYFESREKEVVGIMMALFDQEEVFDTYVKSERMEAAREAAEEAERRTRKETAVQLLKAGRCSVDEIGELFPQLDEGDIIEIKQEFMQQV